MRIAAGTLLAFALSLTPSEAFARTAKEKSQSRDSYVLSRGHSMSANGSIEELEVLRKLYAGDFLWARRSGSAYVIRDPRLLEEAAALFDGLRALDPEQTALERRQEQLGREEERLDLEQERLEIDSDRLSDEEADVSAGVGPVPCDRGAAARYRGPAGRSSTRASARSTPSSRTSTGAASNSSSRPKRRSGNSSTARSATARLLPSLAEDQRREAAGEAASKKRNGHCAASPA